MTLRRCLEVLRGEPEFELRLVNIRLGFYVCRRNVCEISNAGSAHQERDRISILHHLDLSLSVIRNCALVTSPVRLNLSVLRETGLSEMNLQFDIISLSSEPHLSGSERNPVDHYAKRNPRDLRRRGLAHDHDPGM